MSRQGRRGQEGATRQRGDDEQADEAVGRSWSSARIARTVASAPGPGKAGLARVGRATEGRAEARERSGGGRRGAGRRPGRVRSRMGRLPQPFWPTQPVSPFKVELMSVGRLVGSPSSCLRSRASCGSAPSARLAAAGGGVTRTYYIAADEVVWDYAPSGANAAEGRPFNAFEKPWMEAGPNVAGRKAKKALYREYTDATFATLKPRPAEWEHLGFLGPLIRAEVGDTIKVVFRNNAKFAGGGPSARRPLQQGFRGRQLQRRIDGRRQGRRRGADRRHAHLHLGGARARRPDGARRQLRVLDVSLAQRRDPRRRERPDRPA